MPLTLKNTLFNAKNCLNAPVSLQLKTPEEGVLKKRHFSIKQMKRGKKVAALQKQKIPHSLAKALYHYRLHYVPQKGKDTQDPSMQKSEALAILSERCAKKIGETVVTLPADKLQRNFIEKAFSLVRAPVDSVKVADYNHALLSTLSPTKEEFTQSILLSSPQDPVMETFNNEEFTLFQKELQTLAKSYDTPQPLSSLKEDLTTLLNARSSSSPCEDLQAPPPASHNHTTSGVTRPHQAPPSSAPPSSAPPSSAPPSSAPPSSHPKPAPLTSPSPYKPFSSNAFNSKGLLNETVAFDPKTRRIKTQKGRLNRFLSTLAKPFQRHNRTPKLKSPLTTSVQQALTAYHKHLFVNSNRYLPNSNRTSVYQNIQKAIDTFGEKCLTQPFLEKALDLLHSCEETKKIQSYNKALLSSIAYTKKEFVDNMSLYMEKLGKNPEDYQEALLEGFSHFNALLEKAHKSTPPLKAEEAARILVASFEKCSETLTQYIANKETNLPLTATPTSPVPKPIPSSTLLQYISPSPTPPPLPPKPPPSATPQPPAFEDTEETPFQDIPLSSTEEEKNPFEYPEETAPPDTKETPFQDIPLSSTEEEE